MKLYEYNKNNNVCLIKICGFSIFEQTNDLINLNKKQRFCSGIIETDKIIFSDGVIKDIKVFGVSVIKRKDLNGFRKYYILGKEIFSVALYELFKRRYVKYFDSKYDNIYILHANCGEVYLTLVHFFDAIIKKHQSQNPLLVATQKCHVDLIKMICPNVPYIYLKNMDILVKDSCFKIDKFRIFILYDDSYYHQTEKNIISSRIGECHYFNSLKEKLELSNDDITMRKIIISDKEKLSVLNKVRQIGLNLDRFIFISPEANTCKLYDDDFWIELIKKIEETGYDVFVNLTNNEMNLKDFVNFKTCYLTLAEVFVLAGYANKIIGLRSGLLELLLQTKTPMEILYTRFKNRKLYLDTAHILSGFSLLKLPFDGNQQIREFDMFAISQKDCIKEIMANL